MLKWSYDFISSEKVKEYKDGAVAGGGGGGGGGGIERWYQRPQSETGRDGHNGCGGHLQYFAGPSSTLNTIRVSDNTLVDRSLSIQIQRWSGFIVGAILQSLVLWSAEWINLLFVSYNVDFGINWAIWYTHCVENTHGAPWPRQGPSVLQPCTIY